MSMTRNEFRQEAAIRCLQGLLANPHENQDRTPKGIAIAAMDYADALTEQYLYSGDFYEPNEN